MKTFAICTIEESSDKLRFEARKVYDEASKLYDQVILLNPRLVRYKFQRGFDKPDIRYKNLDISNLHALLVRSTVGREMSYAMLVRALACCGCNLIDPLDRFPVGKSSKLKTIINGFQNKTGIDTYISFEISNTMILLEELDECYPLISKPIYGKKGRDIILLNDIDSARKWSKLFFDKSSDLDEPILFQKFIHFQSEYRVFIIDDECIGVVKKILPSGGFFGNIDQGCKFVQVFEKKVVDFTINNIKMKGVVGVDVGRDFEGNYYIIDRNRSPSWQGFENATGINVASELVKRTL
jgi:glutathione synthase/RimK-type ligase-like ATP-grasp enzyme